MNDSRTLATAAFVLLLIALPLSAQCQQTVEVVIQNYRFEPKLVHIKVGDTVKWINKEKRTSHSVVFSAEQRVESERFFPDESWQRRFTVSGRFPYHCGPHPEMTGVVEVGGS
ncbi:MAG: cupredoxin domain-containing protein [Rhodoferax sp.]|nr:cupredoxin domain-containing protein [Rhodoferax sp.]